MVPAGAAQGGKGFPEAGELVSGVEGRSLSPWGPQDQAGVWDPSCQCGSAALCLWVKDGSVRPCVEGEHFPRQLITSGVSYLHPWTCQRDSHPPGEGTSLPHCLRCWAGKRELVSCPLLVLFF